METRIPDGPVSQKWTRCQQELRLLSPHQRRRYRVLVVGAGLAGASAASALAEQGFQITIMTLADSPRRSHSVAAQGGINAAKNYVNDGDSVFRMFADTLRGGDFRAREASVYRLAELSGQVIDSLVAQGVPFAREYGGGLRNRSFGGVQVSRTFYSRGQTGQQLLLGMHGAMLRQVSQGNVTLLTRRELLDLVVVDGRAVGIIARDLVSGQLEPHAADAVVIATGGYSSVFHLSTNAINSNATAIWRCHRRGAWFANPSFIQFHPTCIPQLNRAQSKLTLMSESLRNDGRIWVPVLTEDTRDPVEIPESERDYFLERLYPAYGNLVPRDIASRACRSIVESGRGVGPTGGSVYLDFAQACNRLGEAVLRDRYANLYDMYREMTGDDPCKTPMQISPAPHFSMGGLWVDYHLRSNLSGLFVIGEANCADHGANRLGANSLLQTMVDGLFVLPRTLSHELAVTGPSKVDCAHAQFARCEQECRANLTRLLECRGRSTPQNFHFQLGQILLTRVGLSRSDPGLRAGLDEIASLQSEFASQLVIGGGPELNANLEKAGRVSDFLQLAGLMCRDALQREESCGAHFRIEHQTEEGQPIRRDRQFSSVSAWEWAGQDAEPVLHCEPLNFELLAPVTRSYS
ncbi:fumarate reductase/succinate dehydrogenase flavoprotein subunit [bacterium]|nr:fumarate reductase/succinate dehydrogenase flavoprotein subunit [bacterium]